MRYLYYLRFLKQTPQKCIAADHIPQRLDSLKTTWYSYTYWFWSASQWWSTFRILPRHPGRSISTTSVNVKQIITAWLHSDITSEIMCRHLLDPHITPGKPIFHPDHFSFEIQTGAYHTPAKKPGLPKSDLANFRPISNLNAIGKILERLSSPFTFLSTHFKISQFFSVTCLLIGNFISLRLPCLN